MTHAQPKRPSQQASNFIQKFNGGLSKVTIDFKNGFVDFDCDLFLNTHLKCHAASKEEFEDIMNGIINKAIEQGFAN